MNHSIRVVISLCTLVLGTSILCGQPIRSGKTAYTHDFADGQGGWLANERDAVLVLDGVANSYSPWYVDPDHAPPGAGYFQPVLWIYTDKRRYQPDQPAAAALPYRTSSFVTQGVGKNLRGAKLTVRLRGKVELRDAKLVLVAEAMTANGMASFVLNAQPLTISVNWSDQIIVLTSEANQWLPLGARIGTTRKVSNDEVGTVLSDLNLDLKFVLFPVRVEPACKGVDDIHAKRAGYDYPIETQHLPTGLIQVKSIRIEYPEA